MPMIQSFRTMKLDYYECTIGITEIHYCERQFYETKKLCIASQVPFGSDASV